MRVKCLRVDSRDWTHYSSGGKKKRKYSGSADADADWLPSAKGKPGSDDIPKRKSKRSLKPKTER